MILIATLIAAILAFSPGLAQQPDKDGFVPLFNGKDLSNWRPATNWAVENGVIVLKDRSDRKEHNDNYLWTQESYGDFVLDLEFRPVQGTNSGIFLRTSDVADPVYTGIEVQVAPTAPPAPGGGIRKNGVGAIYDLVQPKQVEVKPEEWHRYTITCRGSNISVVLSGIPVSEMDLDRWTEVGQNPDGSTNKFKRALKDFARTGYIGLQDHGTPVSYRNIRIKKL
jgi:hypothetical protein